MKADTALEMRAVLKDLAQYEWIEPEGVTADCCTFCGANRHNARYDATGTPEPHTDDCLWRRARVLLGMEIPK